MPANGRRRISSGRRGFPPRRRRPVWPLRALVKVRDDEIGSLLWSCLFVFSLLAGNYLIRPVRDEMGIAGGTTQPAGPLRRHVPGHAHPGAVACLAMRCHEQGQARPRRRSFAPTSSASRRSSSAFQMMPASGSAWAARGFFVLASVANLLVVSIAWGSLVCRFTTDQAHRLFGFIAAGGTLGAIAGSAIAGTLAATLGPAPLIVAAIALLEVSLLAARRALAADHRRSTGPAETSSTQSDREAIRSDVPAALPAGPGSLDAALHHQLGIRLPRAGPDRPRRDQRAGPPDRVLRPDRPSRQRAGPGAAGLAHGPSPCFPRGRRFGRDAAGRDAGRARSSWP